MNTFISVYNKATPRKKKLLKTFFPSPRTARLKDQVVTNIKTKMQDECRKMDKSSRRRKLFVAGVATQSGAQEMLGMRWAHLCKKVVKTSADTDEELLKRKKQSDTLSHIII